MSLADALCLIYEQGSEDSPTKKQRLRNKIKKDAKKACWEDALMSTLDSEWQWRLCNARLHLGYLDWKGWGYRNPRNGIVPFKYPMWDKKSHVKNLLIIGEQGLGDEVLYSALLERIENVESITVDCEPRLQQVFSESFPDIEFIGRKDLFDDWTQGEFDAQMFWGDVFPLFLRKPTDFPRTPWIKVNPKYDYKTAISWRGRQGGFNPDGICADVSVQYDEIGDFPIPSFDLRNDIYEVFSLLAGCERLISAPTSVVHFAGSLGVPVDVIMDKTGLNHGGFEPFTNNALNWRFSEQFNRGHKMLFHPSAKVYPSLENWKYENRRRLVCTKP